PGTHLFFRYLFDCSAICSVLLPPCLLLMPVLNDIIYIDLDSRAGCATGRENVAQCAVSFPSLVICTVPTSRLVLATCLPPSRPRTYASASTHVTRSAMDSPPSLLRLAPPRRVRCFEAGQR
ncbi:hypothetical protein BD626DRAFT_503509, partial [Schizophyllum amplum]